MAKKKGKANGVYPIKIYCSKCKTLLYEYNKEGPGHLLKCFVDRIKTDHTNGNLKCPKCEQEFARHGKIGTRPIHKIIAGKVYKQGWCGD